MKKILTKILVSSILLYSCIFTALAVSPCEAPTGTEPISVELNEPLGDCGVIHGTTTMDFILGYVRTVYIYGASIGGIIAVLVIAVSGMQYSFDSESADAAKTRIKNCLSGLALLFLSSVFLYFINPNFFQI